jgi:hypothetical protein
VYLLVTSKPLEYKHIDVIQFKRVLLYLCDMQIIPPVRDLSTASMGVDDDLVRSYTSLHRTLITCPLDYAPLALHYGGENQCLVFHRYAYVLPEILTCIQSCSLRLLPVPAMGACFFPLL